jgi:hypothetical protein
MALLLSMSRSSELESQAVELLQPQFKNPRQSKCNPLFNIPSSPFSQPDSPHDQIIAISSLMILHDQRHLPRTRSSLQCTLKQTFQADDAFHKSPCLFNELKEETAAWIELLIHICVVFGSTDKQQFSKDFICKRALFTVSNVVTAFVNRSYHLAVTQ